MPRKARIDAPGAVQHIIIRGIERKAIFRDTADKDTFIERFGKIVIQTSTPCYAWVLMDNHAHLLLRTGQAPVSTLMRRLLTGYAQYFNRRYKRHGQLFQNRYRSFLCDEDEYLLELVRYIHLNPVRAKMIKDLKGLNRFKYAGHSVLMGKYDHPWQDCDYILKRFDRPGKKTRKRYLKFIIKGMNQGRRPELRGGGLLRSVGGWSSLKAMRSLNMRVKGDERILGSGEFVEKVLKHANEKLELQATYEARGITFDTLLELVSRHFDISLSDLKTNSFPIFASK
jgi:REP element-mobilizing transposase RayT